MLIQLTSENAFFQKLKAQWEGECSQFGESLADYAAPQLEHAEKIANEATVDQGYGVFALRSSDGSYDCLMHVNRARLPSTTGETLRIVWILIAPRFDFSEISVSEFARLASGVIHGAIGHSDTGNPTKHVKIHLSGMGDREFFTGVALGLQENSAFETVAVRGNWLHITKALHALA